MSEVNYNPDVLTCLANLSSDEVFTPPALANAMLDLFPQELWSNPNTKILDPAVKSGVFLREAAKRLIKGLEPIIPDLQERIDHIYKKQLFGIAITELTSLLSRRSAYCSKTANGPYSIVSFKTAHGNISFNRIEHQWNEEKKCELCGAGKDRYDNDPEKENHAYEFIHLGEDELKEKFKNMKFDLIISNPPYHLADGGSGTKISASPIYNLFVQQAKKLHPRYISMIIPSRWFAGGKGLNSFRDEMLADRRIRHIVDFMSSKDCFPGVNIAGGVNYFLWDRDYSGDCKIDNCSMYHEKITAIRSLKEFPILIRDNRAVNIIHKFQKSGDSCLTDNTYKRNPFGFESSCRGEQKPIIGCDSVKLISSSGVGYIKRSEVRKAVTEIDRYKVIIGKVVPNNGEVDTNPLDGYKVTTTSRVIGPKEIHTETYLLLHGFDDIELAKNFSSYMSLKFPRFMMKQTLSSMNISSENFRFVPFLDYKKKWTDQELYMRYKLTSDEISFIESYIKDMSTEGNLNE